MIGLIRTRQWFISFLLTHRNKFVYICRPSGQLCHDEFEGTAPTWLPSINFKQFRTYIAITDEWSRDRAVEKWDDPVSFKGGFTAYNLTMIYSNVYLLPKHNSTKTCWMHRNIFTTCNLFIYLLLNGSEERFL